jgi:hypothetical protein
MPQKTNGKSLTDKKLTKIEKIKMLEPDGKDAA